MPYTYMPFLLSALPDEEAYSYIVEVPKQKDQDYALRLYFAEAGESIWEISKRYNTSAAAILAENDLESDTRTAAGMILIPIV